MRQDGAENRRVVFLVGILFLNLILMSSRIILNNNRSLLFTGVGYVVAPVGIVFQKSTDFISRNFRHYVFVTNTFSKYRKLKKENSRLKYENYLLRRKIGPLEYRRQVYRDSPGYKAANLVFIDPKFPFHSILVDQGSLQGVRPGMVVLNEHGDLVGRVVEPVQLFASRVRLITSSMGGIGASIERDRMEGLIQGDNSRTCAFLYLMKKWPVKVGDHVVTSGTDGLFPVGLPLGEVVDVKTSHLVHTVRVRPFFVERSLKRLMILNETAEN